MTQKKKSDSKGKKAAVEQKKVAAGKIYYLIVALISLVIWAIVGVWVNRIPVKMHELVERERGLSVQSEHSTIRNAVCNGSGGCAGIYHPSDLFGANIGYVPNSEIDASLTLLEFILGPIPFAVGFLLLGAGLLRKNALVIRFGATIVTVLLSYVICAIVFTVVNGLS